MSFHDISRSRSRSADIPASSKSESGHLLDSSNSKSTALSDSSKTKSAVLSDSSKSKSAALSDSSKSKSAALSDSSKSKSASLSDSSKSKSAVLSDSSDNRHATYQDSRKSKPADVPNARKPSSTVLEDSRRARSADTRTPGLSSLRSSLSYVRSRSAEVDEFLAANAQTAFGLGFLYHSFRAMSLYYLAHGPPPSPADMLPQAAAILVGLVAVRWVFYDPDVTLVRLEGKRVLITGASSGIGEQLAYRFAQHGCHVTMTARNLKALKAVSAHCQEVSPSNDVQHHVITGDLMHLNKTDFLVEGAVSQMGGLDILVLNHILPHPIRPFKPGKDDFELLSDLLKVNFRSYVHLASHALPHLSKVSGRIVVINSAMGKVGHPYLASYAATKHALSGFFSSWRSQFQATNVDVGITSCFLGYIGTESAIQGLKAAGQTRLQRWVTPAKPEDTAKAIAIAVANEQDELYYPGGVGPLTVLHSLWPSLVDKLMRFISRAD